MFTDNTQIKPKQLWIQNTQTPTPDVFHFTTCCHKTRWSNSTVHGPTRQCSAVHTIIIKDMTYADPLAGPNGSRSSLSGE